VYGGRRRIPRGATQPLIAELESFKRQALHATRLALEHPLTGKPLEWEVPPPPDMAQLLAALAQDFSASRDERSADEERGRYSGSTKRARVK
jgi:23S rRNA pseudouridine1911/1915/1917 synthase